jgi:hypothetical protein
VGLFFLNSELNTLSFNNRKKSKKKFNFQRVLSPKATIEPHWYVCTFASHSFFPRCFACGVMLLIRNDSVIIGLVKNR